MNFKKGDIVEVKQGEHRLVFKLYSDARLDNPMWPTLQEDKWEWMASGIHIEGIYKGTRIYDFHLRRCKKINTWGVQRFKKKFTL